jgi:hypothetical protein
MTIEQIVDNMEDVVTFVETQPVAGSVAEMENDQIQAIALHAIAGTMKAEAERLLAETRARLFAEERKRFESNADWKAYCDGKLAQIQYWITRCDQILSNLHKRIDAMRTMISYEKQQLATFGTHH